MITLAGLSFFRLSRDYPVNMRMRGIRETRPLPRPKRTRKRWAIHAAEAQRIISWKCRNRTETVGQSSQYLRSCPHGLWLLMKRRTDDPDPSGVSLPAEVAAQRSRRTVSTALGTWSATAGVPSVTEEVACIRRSTLGYAEQPDWTGTSRSDIHVMFILLRSFFTWFSQTDAIIHTWTGIWQGFSQVGECGIAWPRPFVETATKARKHSKNCRSGCERWKRLRKKFTPKCSRQVAT